MDDKELALLIFKAIHALRIDVPIMGVVLLPGDRVQLALYGGRVVVFPPGDEGRMTRHALPDDRNGDTAIASCDPDPAASKGAVARVQPSAESPHACPAEEFVILGEASPKEIGGRAANSQKLRVGLSGQSPTVTPEIPVDPEAAPEIAIPAERDLPPKRNIGEYNHPAVRDLEGMELVTLQDLARRSGIKVTRKMNRDALIAALRGVK